MNILGIETSCDETAAAVVRDGREVLANVVYTQIPLHRPYGGVVPELASRAHVEKISEVVRTALERFAEREPGGRINAVAVTYGPGLSPALIVGLNAAKGIASALGVELIGINHIEAHLHTPFLADTAAELAAMPPPAELMPALGLAVSGGHTTWVDMPEYGTYRVLGQTLDDAAGEAFDKAAKLLELGYPGGLLIDRIGAAYLAKYGAADLPVFPKGRPREGVSALAGLKAELCVSFSGLKTALLRYVQQHPELKAAPAAGVPTLAVEGHAPVALELARTVTGYQAAIVGALKERTAAALKVRDYRALIVGGGVSLNSHLRAALKEVAERAGVHLALAKARYCGDNGAMIAALAYHRRNRAGAAALALDVAPSLDFE